MTSRIVLGLNRNEALHHHVISGKALDLLVPESEQL